MASIPQPFAPETEQPEVASALRKLAVALDELGAFALHLATIAERPPEVDPLLTAAEAAAELRCTASFIRRECARGSIAALKNGGWYVRLSALRTYERRHTTGG